MISASVIAAAPTGVDTRTCSPHGARTADLDLTGRKRNRDAGSEERKADCSIYSRGRSDTIAWTNVSFRLLRHTPHTRNALRKGGYPSGNLGRYDVCSSALYSFFSPSAPHIGRFSEKARGPAIFPERERLVRRQQALPAFPLYLPKVYAPPAPGFALSQVNGTFRGKECRGLRNQLL